MFYCEWNEKHEDVLQEMGYTFAPRKIIYAPLTARFYKYLVVQDDKTMKGINTPTSILGEEQKYNQRLGKFVYVKGNMIDINNKGELVNSKENYETKTKNTSTSSELGDSKDKRSSESCEEINSFTKHNFEIPKFEGEIFKKVGEYYMGYIIDEYNDASPCQWSEKGSAYTTKGERFERFNLTPLQKPWYEDESNFPTLLVFKEEGLHGQGKMKYCPSAGIAEQEWAYSGESVRLATEEEILSLIVKDNK